MRKTQFIIAPFASTLLLFGGVLTAQEPEETHDAPFGREADIQLSKDAWKVLQALRLVGEDRLHAFPYEGTEPHGKLLETFKTSVEVEGEKRELWVKNNFAGEGLTKTDVLTDPEKYLQAITIMFKMPEGYDVINDNWFWAKYQPDGSLVKSPEGVPMAGRVLGCIECHGKAPGGDMLYSTAPAAGGNSDE